MIEETGIVLFNNQIGPRLYLMRLESPSIAPQVRPGQFVHMKLNGFEAHILRRPFSVYDTNAAEGTLDILYQLVGEGTEFMATAQPGSAFDLMGPIGRGWTVAKEGERIMIIGGGVGAAPLQILTRESIAAGATVDVCLAATTREVMVTLDKYTELLGHQPYCATNDGSVGVTGYINDTVLELLQTNAYDRVHVCGPLPLMRANALACIDANVPCEVSMEERMACGIGACLSCVVETVDGKQRACVDGPVFDAKEVVW